MLDIAVPGRCIGAESRSQVGILDPHLIEGYAYPLIFFVDAAFRGSGVGKTLLLYAVDSLNVRYVDVNEQNPRAVGFYTHMGFDVIGRSPIDGDGKPYPLLHLQYSGPGQCFPTKNS